MKKKITKENIQSVIDCYNEVKSLKETSKRLGISIPTIHKSLKEAGFSTALDRKLLGEKIRKFELDPFYFSEINTRDKAYITGILHSDGCITSTTRQVRIKLADIDLVEEINSKIYLNRPTYSDSSTKDGHKKNALIVISHHQIYSDVQKHGCCLNKTYNLDFPTTIPLELMGDYFRGFFDGDGSIYIYEKKSYRPATVKIVATRLWAKKAIDFLKSIGIDSAIYDDKRHDNRITGLHICNVPSLIKFYDFIYKDIKDQIFLKRKHEKYTDYFNFKTNNL